MAGRAYQPRPEPGPSLPALERLSPPPPAGVITARIDALTAAGDVVLDLHGRGGWIARAAVDRQRRAITVESTPLDRLLAEVVLRPPDLRHLDAAFQAIAASPRRDTSLKLWVGERFASRCATCGRSVVLDELAWEADGDTGAAHPTMRHYRCTLCRDQRGGGEQRHAPPTEDDLSRASDDGGDEAVTVHRTIAERFPPLDAPGSLAEALLALHSPRQLLGLAAILERVEGDLRAAPVEAALRLAFLHAILPASRLDLGGGRVAALRLVGGMPRVSGTAWRERNPWLAFEDGYRLVRAFIQRIEGGSHGPVQARFGDDLRALLDGTASVSVRVSTPSAPRHLAAEARDAERVFGPTGVRLLLSQPPLRPTVDRALFAYLATAWALGREAASLLPLQALAAPTRIPWGWQAAALTRSLRAAEPILAPDARAVLLPEASGPEAVVAAVLGGVGAGYRLASVRFAQPGEDAATVELVPPGAAIPPGPRTRANVPLEAVPDGAGDPALVPGRGLFAPPERFDQRPFSAAEAARSVTGSAVEVLRARGEPARTERLLGDILVGLDRAGHLRRLVSTGASRTGDGEEDRAPRATRGVSPRGSDALEPPPADAGPSAEAGPSGPSPRGERSDPLPEAPPTLEAPELWARGSEEAEAGGLVERLLAIIREELGRAGQRRLVEIEPDRWWLADRADRDAAAVPLADRVEWAVFSLLSTGGPLSEAAFLERIASLFAGHDLPDEALVRACLASYRSLASTADRLVGSDDLVRRTEEHTELLALLADLGHRLGMSVWLSRREQERLHRGHRLADWLEPREQRVHLPLIARAPVEELGDVDAIWYVRARGVFHFEVEWTAMLHESVLRRHARIPGDEATVRFLVIVPERAELLRYKLERSPVLRAAMEGGNWHVLKANHLRTFAALESPSLDALEPLLGLDPLVERSSEQLPLFG
ncbi:MAG TPA: hypothetical protein VEY67_10760 [Candidatus Dormibacteraeota bacterium]|nr:hypothetical protein [Candidatus Dormibacteraeota bacterium]